ncbi:uncharacterized protein BJ212DRAFT_1351777 [Suillus subaureus]|uniref:Uncharacterized protein n=1 Tax=Suillus subaureus TaxID=48587 RepID=A0A9P7ECH1_9AGAM|nr:uncharacterized protein BJ212DRAFT_1351777 [Suillus subaureus]KAG1817244.1 hypothetical protein BJ212DRAFT_1351777 [Suillus subaureus]
MHTPVTVSAQMTTYERTLNRDNPFQDYGRPRSFLPAHLPILIAEHSLPSLKLSARSEMRGTVQ